MGPCIQPVDMGRSGACWGLQGIVNGIVFKDSSSRGPYQKPQVPSALNNSSQSSRKANRAQRIIRATVGSKAWIGSKF